MARLTPKGQLSGALGNTYFRVLNGKTIIQSKPGKRKKKHSEAMRTTNSKFGSMSSATRMIRLALSPILAGYSDTYMYRRFTGKVYEAVKAGNGNTDGSGKMAAGDWSLLRGFEFNTNSPLADYCALQPEVAVGADNVVRVGLPGFDPKDAFVKPAGAQSVEYCILVTVLDPETLMERMLPTVFKLPAGFYAGPVPSQQWATPALPESSLILVTAAVFYYGQNILGNHTLNNKLLHPCGLVDMMGMG